MQPDFYYDEDTQVFIRSSKFQREDYPNAKAVYVTDSNVTSAEELQKEGLAVVPCKLPEDILKAARSAYGNATVYDVADVWNYCVSSSRVDRAMVSKWQAAANLARRVFTRYSQHHAAKGALEKSIENARLADAMHSSVPVGLTRRYWAHGKSASVGVYHQDVELLGSVVITFVTPATIIIEQEGWAFLPMFADLFEVISKGVNDIDTFVQECEKLGIRK